MACARGYLPARGDSRAASGGYAPRMSFLRGATRAYLLNRVLRDRRRRQSGWGRMSGHGSPYGRSPYGRHPRRRSSGFGMRGPFPTYSRRTRGGSQVSVSGCCLPIPLALTLGAGVAVQAARSR